MMKHDYEKKNKGRSVFLKSFLLLTFLSCICYFSTQAQEAQVSGTVTDASTGQPLTGVSVRVKGSKIGTITDSEGAFEIFSKKGDSLTFTYLGYKKKEITIGNSSKLSIQLEKSFSKLNQVVVIGYGQMQRKNLSTSQTTVSSEEIDRTINPTLESAIQGRAAGVYVSKPSGQPGAAPSIVVRGMGTLTQSTQPLYVIDGVQIKPSVIPDDPNNKPTGYSNILSTLNPSNIATINILKGPSATAIYGAAGGNGVVIITTKQGKAGKTKISASTLFTVQAEPQNIKVMNLPQYATYRNEMEKAIGFASEPTFADPSVLGKGTNWQDALYRSTLLQKHQLSVSGGDQKTKFYISGEYFKQEGTAKGSGFRRYSVRVNVENQTRPWMKMGVHSNIGYTKEKVNTTNGDVVKLATEQNPGIPVQNPDGSWGGPQTKQFQYTNPVMLAQIYDDYNKRLAIIGDVFLNINPVKGLTIHNSFNTSLSYFNYYSWHPGYDAGGFVVPLSSAESDRRATHNFWWSINNRIKYHFNLNQKHDFTLMVAHEANSWTNETLSGWRKNYVTDVVTGLSGGDASNISNVKNNSGKSDGAQESYFGRLNYIYDNKYILQATYRADGSSSFGANNKWGFFPSLSLAWRISEESFMSSLNAVDNLKLRFGIGESGNSGGASGIYAALQTIPSPWGTGFLAQKFPNPNLKWETDKTVNVGFDLHMFDNRLSVIADAYIKKSTNLITVNTYPFALGGDIAWSSGYVQWPTVNAGTIENKGIEVSVNTVNIDNKLTWKSGVTFSLNRNKILSLINPMNTAWNSTQVQFISKVGKPTSMITGYIAQGFFQNYDDIANHAIQTSDGVMDIDPTGSWVGDIKFKDINDDGVVDQNDRTVIGNPWPKFTYGFNNSFSYENFSLNIFIQGVYGNDIVNYPRYTMEIPGNSGTYSNYFASILNFARPSSYKSEDKMTMELTNPGHHISRILDDPSQGNGNNRMNQWFVEDGSYLRIKNVTLSYQFPQKWISHLAMTNLKASVSVQNLLTITSYSGYDPEIGMVNYGGTIMNGIDTWRYPTVRMYSISLSANF
ncbi:MAG TPA: TonB-dependent receptor [Chitinophagaceae bacterium]|nr:TonB-dependent receptor [Chitinophagaceae bacterium]